MLRLQIQESIREAHGHRLELNHQQKITMPTVGCFFSFFFLAKYTVRFKMSFYLSCSVPSYQEVWILLINNF